MIEMKDSDLFDISREWRYDDQENIKEPYEFLGYIAEHYPEAFAKCLDEYDHDEFERICKKIEGRHDEDTYEIDEDAEYERQRDLRNAN